MSYAIAAGLIKKGLPSKKIIVSGLDEASFKIWGNLEVQQTLKNIEVFNKSDLIILCVKPNNLEEVSANIEKDFVAEYVNKFQYSKKVLLSILAGVQLKILKDSFSFLKGSIEILRAMPNTPLQVGAGCTAITPYSGQQKEMISSIFKALGEVEFLDESKFDAITGLRYFFDRLFLKFC
jgi:pyrroline-5-carboxylate reductase